MRTGLAIAELVCSAVSAEAVSFLRYVTRPEAAAIWHGCAIEMNGAVA